MIDVYCERIGPGLWAEPVNALTNLAFFVAAWAAWELRGRSATHAVGLPLLSALVVAVGIGSILFHTFATPWSRVLDVVPILTFQLAFFWLYSRNVLRAGVRLSSLAAGALVAIALLGRQFPEPLNGSITYIPAFVLVLGLGGYHFAAHKRERFVLLAAAGAFLIALFARSVDEAVCAYMPAGTHFLWHVLNALAIYLLLRGLAANMPASAERRAGAAP